MQVISQLHASIALTPEKKDLVTHWIGVSVGFRADVDAVN
jgi:hypothetical protein